MGRLNKGPNGPVSGKFGSVIGSSWKGIYYLKGLQKDSTKERSQLQIEQQSRFAFAVKTLHPIKRHLNTGFGKINPHASTGYNMALSHMLLNSIKGEYPNFELDYSKVQFSQGKIKLPASVSTEISGRTLKLNWSTETEPRLAFNGDFLNLLVYSPKANNYQPCNFPIIRGNGQVEIELAENDNEVVRHIFIFMISQESGKLSETLYVGSVECEF